MSLFLCLHAASYLRFSLEFVMEVSLIVFQAAILPLFRPLGCLMIVGLFAVLMRLLPRTLEAPLAALQSQRVTPQAIARWRVLLFLNAALAVPLLLETALFDLRRAEGSYFLGVLLSVAFLGCYIVYGLYLSKGMERPTESFSARDGAAEEFSNLVISLSIWTNALFALGLCFTLPYLTMDKCRAVGIQLALVGIVIALVISQFEKQRLAYLLGFLASLMGGRLGEPLARLVGLVLVFGIRYSEHRDEKLALTESWGFGIGQAVGHIGGAFLGLFYLGLEGAPIGAALGEALLALVGFQLAGTKRVSSQRESL